MELTTKRKIMAILKVLHEAGGPVGSAVISEQLEQWGIDLGERMIRYYLEMMDKDGLTENLGRRGRAITDLGRKELDVGIAIDNVGFVAARVDELSYRMDFDIDKGSGSVIVNRSLIKTHHASQTLSEIKRIYHAGLGMGRLVRVTYPGQSGDGTTVPKDHIAVQTLCSVTLNGIFLKHGITMTSRFGGLLELCEREPVRFSQIIHYDGSTLDPLVVFIKGKMTSVRQAAMTGTGTIGASFREVPTATLPVVQELIEKLDAVGFGGVLMVGKPNQPLLDIPVSYGRVGMIVAGGLNPIAALEELGVETQNQALHTLCDCRELMGIDSIS